MSRRGGSSSAHNIQLLPFLDILTCTMGALVTLLFAFARYGQQQVAVVSDARQEAADNAAAEEVEDLKWRASLLRDSREQTENDLNSARLELSHLEDHLRRLRQHADEIHRAAAALENAGVKQPEKTSDEELAKLKQQIAESEKKLDIARKDAKTRPTTYSIVPYHGPNQTHRQPIYLECRDEGIVLEPEGIVFTDNDFAGPLGPGNALAAAVRAAREYMAAADPDSLDQVEPYPLLIVRPNAITQYYAARNALQSFGSQFGYELIGADKKLAFPPADPRLAEIINQAVAEARVRQRQLMLAAPNRYKGKAKPNFRVKDNGRGIERDDDDSQQTNNLSKNPYAGIPIGRPGGGNGNGTGQTVGKGNGQGGPGNGNGLAGIPGTGSGTGDGFGAPGSNGSGFGNGSGNGSGPGGGGLPGGQGLPGGAGGGGGVPGTLAGGPGGGNGSAPYVAGPYGAYPYGNGPNGTGPNGNGPDGNGGNGPDGTATDGGLAGGTGLTGTGNGAAGQPDGQGNGSGTAPNGGFIGGGPGGAMTALASGGTGGINGAGTGPGGTGSNGPGGNGAGGGGVGANGAGMAGFAPGTPGGVPGGTGYGLGNAGQPGGNGYNPAPAAGPNGAGGAPGATGGGPNGSLVGTPAIGTPGGGQATGSGNGGDGNGGNSPGTAGQTGTGAGGAQAGRIAMAGTNTQQTDDDAEANAQAGVGSGQPLSSNLASSGSGGAGGPGGSANGPGTGPGGGGMGGTGGGPAGGNSQNGVTPTGPPKRGGGGGPAANTDRIRQITNPNGHSIGGGADDTGSSTTTSTPYNNSASVGGTGAASTSQSTSMLNNSGSSSSSSSSSSSAQSGGQAGGGSQGGQQQQVGIPNPLQNLMGQQPQQQQDPTQGKHGKKHSLAQSRGNDWTLPERKESSVGVNRPVVIQCWPDRLVILGDDAKTPVKTIKMGEHTEDSVDELVSAILKQMKSWGSAGPGSHWRPTLKMRVASDAHSRFEELQTLLADSGMEIAESNKPLPVAGKPGNPLRK